MACTDLKTGKAGGANGPLRFLLTAWSRIDDTGIEHVVCALLPVIYVWILPFAAKAEWPRTVDSDEDPYPNTFFNKCEGYPRCASSDIGISVSNYISTPMGTGLMACTFFHPLFHLWSIKPFIKAYVQGGLLTWYAFNAFFGAFLAAPVTKYPNVHLVATGLFCLCALFVFRGLLLKSAERVKTRCKALLWISVISFSGVIFVNLITLLKPHDWLKMHQFWWIFYAFEALGLTCMSLFPWFWRSAESLEDLEEEAIFMEVQVFGLGSLRPIIVLLATLPAVYLYNLPRLSGKGFAHRCAGYPYCEGDMGMSVSNFLSTPQATGAMAAVSFWPLAHLWSERNHYGTLLHSTRPGLAKLWQLIAFISFFVLLIFPQEKYPAVTTVTVPVYAVFFCTYYIALLSRGALTQCHMFAYFMMSTSIVCIGCLVFLRGFFLHDSETLLRNLNPAVPFYLEATALSCCSFLTWKLNPPRGQAAAEKEALLESGGPEGLQHHHAADI